MRFSTLSLSLLLPALSAAAPTCGNPSPKAAAYFLDNNPAGSSIVALAIGSDGKLSDPVRTSTGGKGLFGLTAGTNGAAAMAGGADTLFSQDSVVVSGEYLLTVNAGSNTVSLFTIPKDDILHPKLACSPVSTLGEFPQSIAYSPLHKTACVLNGGTVAGITCYSVSSSGLKTLGGLRPISLNETTPPVGPAGTVSDIIFNPSQTALIATVKGNGMDAGFIYAYPVSWGGSIATKPIVSRPSELAVDFSISFLGSDSRAIVTDPSYGASIVEVNSQYEFSVQKKIPVAGEKAICWSVYSRGYDTVFIFDGGVTGITMIDPWSGAIKGTIPGAAETVANLDAQTWKQYMYVLNGAAYVSVVDNSALARGETPSEVQNFDLSSLGSRQGFQGMAVYPSGEGW